MTNFHPDFLRNFGYKLNTSKIFDDLHESEQSMKNIIIEAKQIIDDTLDAYNQGEAPLISVKKICQKATETIEKAEKTLLSIEMSKKEVEKMLNDEF